MDLCETHGRLRCGECAYVEQLEEEIHELKLKNQHLNTEIGRYAGRVYDLGKELERLSKELFTI